MTVKDLWTAEKPPGFLKHLIVGLVSSGLTLGAAVWAASGEWTRRDERIKAVETGLGAHVSAPDLHMTIAEARTQAERLATLEAQQRALIDDVGELKDGVKELLRRAR